MLRSVSVVFSIALSFWIGYLARGSSRPLSAPTSPTSEVKKAMVEQAATPPPTSTSKLGVTPKATPQPAAALLSEPPEKLMRRAIAEPIGLKRLNRWQAALASVTPENWREIFDIVAKARRELQVTSDEEQWMLQRIGIVAREVGVERFKPRDPINQAETHIGRFAMKGWAEVDPAAAWEYIEAQPIGRFRDGMVWGYILGIAPRNVPEALKAMGQLAFNYQADMLKTVLKEDKPIFYAALVESWLRSENRPQGGENTVAALPSARGAEPIKSVFRELMFARTRQGWSDPDGQRFLNWIEQFRGAPYIEDQTLGAAAVHILNKCSPEQAMNWLESFTQDAPQNHQHAIMEVMQRWAPQNTAGVTQWLETRRQSPIYDYALTSFLRCQRGLSGEQILALIATLQNPENEKLLPPVLAR